jgi:prepilin-type N-terminal cleavage/methylation domain-containing protein
MRGMPLALRRSVRQRTHGFTLLELMIVVSIMGAMAALLAPGIGEFMADARASGAAQDLLRLNRHIRSRVQETGLAHLMIFSSSSNDSKGLGRVLVYEGMNNHCRQTPWAQTIGGSVSDGHAPVDQLDLRASTYNSIAGTGTPSIDDSNRQVISLAASDSTGARETVNLCFEPGGTTLDGTSSQAGAGFSFINQTDIITFTVTRQVNHEERGPVRQITFPPGGGARFTF